MKKLLMSIASIVMGTSVLVSCAGLTGVGTAITVAGIASGVDSTGFTVMGVRVKKTAQSSNTTAVANGTTVVVQGRTNDDGSISANEVTIKIEIKGSISSLDAAGSSLVVLGQTIKADANTVFEGSDSKYSSFSSLKIADYVEVYGLRQADNSLLASRIQIEQATKPNVLEVKGTVSGLDTSAKTFLLGTQRVDYSSLNLVPTLSNGLRVEIKGTLNNTNVFIVSKLELETRVVVGTGESIEIEGIGSNLNLTSKAITVQGYVVNYSNATVQGTPTNGAKVEVYGTLNTDGGITARKIEFRTARQGLADADEKLKGVLAARDLTAQTITVAGVIYTVDTNTVLEKMDAPITLADLQLGSTIEIRFVTRSKLIRKLEVEYAGS